MGREERRIWQKGRLNPRQEKHFATAEIILVFAATILYIWHRNLFPPNFPLYLAGFLLLSFALHGDTRKTLGLQLHGLPQALREALLVSCAISLILLGIGIALDSLTMPQFSPKTVWTFIRYFGWCVVQQLGMQSFFTNRLLTVMGKRQSAALLSGLIFAAFHLPNPVLVPVTLVGGYLLAWLFLRQRNLLALAMGQAMIGTLIPAAFPASWHHGLRVGPGYWLWGPH